MGKYFECGRYHFDLSKIGVIKERETSVFSLKPATVYDVYLTDGRKIEIDSWSDYRHIVDAWKKYLNGEN